MMSDPALRALLAGCFFIGLSAVDVYSVWGGEASGTDESKRLSEIQDVLATLITNVSKLESQLEKVTADLRSVSHDLKTTKESFTPTVTTNIKVGEVGDGQALPLDNPDMWRIVLFPKKIAYQEDPPGYNLDNALLAFETCLEDDNKTVRAQELYKWGPRSISARQLSAYYIAIPAELSPELSPEPRTYLVCSSKKKYQTYDPVP